MGFLAVTAASGEAQGGEPAAEALFEEGRKLMAEKRYAEACPKLAESYRLDPAGGALLNLALCHEEEGKTATAWSEFKQALAQARKEDRPERAQFAEEHIAALEPQLSRLTITLAPGTDVPELTISQDGVQLSEAVLGSALPVDPGTHAISASAPGYETWTTTVEVAGGGASAAVSIPTLLEVAGSSFPDVAPDVAPPPAVGEPSADEPVSDGSTQRVLGFVAGGVGLASAIVGAVFGGRAISLDSDADDLCGNEEGSCASTEGYDAWEDAKVSATLSNVFIGVGAGLVAVGAVLLITAPSGEETPESALVVIPEASPDGAGLSMRLRW
jgi:hypothetical protein